MDHAVGIGVSDWGVTDPEPGCACCLYPLCIPGRRRKSVRQNTDPDLRLIDGALINVADRLVHASDPKGEIASWGGRRLGVKVR